ncbi:hypothetical protein BKA67DRAFT_229443 [Truncatella angustata]|uniref:Uncharacterized protein n=1 Tax=Truncatella angustata TaxID=152316 RepID=A0A9P8UMX7_9PEZI|nr:uncharacterized protein BKA67DRAFT_229443 [Truncatella angustata]KAH6655216.1 hypothetical protein BKA67DRAFT_229443 [Truncatella angustata]
MAKDASGKPQMEIDRECATEPSLLYSITKEYRSQTAYDHVGSSTYRYNVAIHNRGGRGYEPDDPHPVYAPSSSQRAVARASQLSLRTFHGHFWDKDTLLQPLASQTAPLPVPLDLDTTLYESFKNTTGTERSDSAHSSSIPCSHATSVVSHGPRSQAGSTPSQDNSAWSNSSFPSPQRYLSKNIVVAGSTKGKPSRPIINRPLLTVDAEPSSSKTADNVYAFLDSFRRTSLPSSSHDRHESARLDYVFAEFQRDLKQFLFPKHNI